MYAKVVKFAYTSLIMVIRDTSILSSKYTAIIEKQVEITQFILQSRSIYNPYLRIG